jgi:probable HAF family extracellular repeat protein
MQGIRRKIGIMMLAAAAVVLSCGTAMAEYTITDLGAALTTGGTGIIGAVAGCINNNGDVVGRARFSDSTPYHATLWRNSVAYDLGSLHDESSASYISDSGLIVGGAYADPSVNNMYRQAVIYSLGSSPVNIHSTMTYNANNSGASSVGAVGSNIYILGQAYNDDASVNHAIRWTYDGANTANTAVDMNPSWSSASALRKINGSGQMVGWTKPSQIGDGRATLWDTDGSVTYLDSTGWQTTSVSDINNAGQVLVWFSNGVNQSFGIWDGTEGTAGLHMFSNPEGRETTSANAINDLGQIVGSAITQHTKTGSGDGHAFLWYSDGTAIDLGALLESAGWYITDAYDINDKGQIVVGANQRGFEYGVTTTLVLTPTPIPAALPLFASGLAALGVFRRRFFAA